MNADVFEAVCAMGDAARTAQSQLAQANTEAKNQLLNAIADALDQHADDIAAANTLDMNQAATIGTTRIGIPVNRHKFHQIKHGLWVYHKSIFVDINCNITLQIL